jgi:hypothetical protein
MYIQGAPQKRPKRRRKKMHGLERIKAENERAAKAQRESKTERPETFDRRKANGKRWPTTDERSADRRPAPHGDPLQPRSTK